MKILATTKKMFDFSKNENIMIIQNSKKINGW